MWLFRCAEREEGRWELIRLAVCLGGEGDAGQGVDGRASIGETGLGIFGISQSLAFHPTGGLWCVDFPGQLFLEIG